MKKEKETKTKKRFKKILVYGTTIMVAGAIGYACGTMMKSGENSATSKLKKLISGFKKSPEAVTVTKPGPVYVNKHGEAYKK